MSSVPRFVRPHQDPDPSEVKAPVAAVWNPFQKTIREMALPAIIWLPVGAWTLLNMLDMAMTYNSRNLSAAQQAGTGASVTAFILGGYVCGRVADTILRK